MVVFNLKRTIRPDIRVRIMIRKGIFSRFRVVFAGETGETVPLVISPVLGGANSSVSFRGSN
jgi:hypothetical protein